MEDKDIILEVINKNRKKLLKKGWFSNHENIYISSLNGEYNKPFPLKNYELHNLNNSDKILLLYSKSVFSKSDKFFTADRIYNYSTAFLENGISTMFSTEIDAFFGKKEGESAIRFIWWSDINFVENFKNHIRFNFIDNRIIDIPLEWFGNSSRGTNQFERIPEIINLIVSSINEADERKELLDLIDDYGLDEITSFPESEQKYIHEARAYIFSTKKSDSLKNILARLYEKHNLSLEEGKFLNEVAPLLSEDIYSSEEEELIRLLKFYFKGGKNISAVERKLLNIEIEPLKIPTKRAYNIEKLLYSLYP